MYITQIRINEWMTQHLLYCYSRTLRYVLQWNLYIKDTMGPAIFVLNREVSSSQRLKIH